MTATNITSLPSILLQSINRYIPSRDVVCVHTRVSHAFYSAASQPYSTKVLPADDDHSHFLSSRSTDIWPWKFTGFEKADEGFIKCNKKLTTITSSKFLHQVRVWPRIPLKDEPPRTMISKILPSKNTVIDLSLLLKLKYLHTLHVSDESDLATIKNLFSAQPFPFTSLHSLSLPFITPTIIKAMPVLIELRRLALTDKMSDISASNWQSFSTKLPRLLFLDLPTNFHLTEEKNGAVIELMRGCGETLKRLECAGVFHKQVLDRLLGDEQYPVANTALEQVIDCGTPYNPKRLPAGLTDDALNELVKFPSMARFTQEYTSLTSIKSLAGIGERLKELTLAGQPLSATISIEFRHVFPQLVALDTLTISLLKSSHEDPSALITYGGSQTLPPLPPPQILLQDEQRYCGLLLAIRSLPMLRKLVLDRIPLLRNHLDILIGVDMNGNVLEGEQYFLTPTTPAGFLHLTEFHLLSINSFVHSTGAMNVNPLRAPDVGEKPTAEGLKKGRIGFERLEEEMVLQKTCKLVMRGVTGLTQEGKVMLKEHFHHGTFW